MKNNYKPGKYLKDDIRICFDCGEEMFESKMSKEMTMMGNGFYPSGCPKCGAKSLPFGRSHTLTNKFGFIRNPESFDEVVEIKALVDKYNEDKKEEGKLWFNQNANSISSFFVKEKKWSNGNREVVQFGTNSKKFTVGYFYKDDCDEFKQALLKHGYTENHN